MNWWIKVIDLTLNSFTPNHIKEVKDIRFFFSTYINHENITVLTDI